MLTTQALSTLVAAMLAMAPSVSAHMIMATPKPFGSPDNSPLDPSGSNFPCKMTTSTPGAGPTNDFAVGSSQTLSFTGSAVHGGGSCQLSVTTDQNPTKDSKFKVIHSIEGGCPGVSGPATFDFKVPDALPNGNATLAWTWFNKIGNREMYMNCAYISVSGGASDTSEFDKLPDMAIANINVGTGASCKTAESSDYTFSDVGSNGDTVDKQGSGPFVALCGGEASSGTGDSSGSTGNAGTGAGTSAGSGAANNGQYTPGSGEGGAAATSAASQAPAASSAVVSAPAASAAVSTAPSALPSDAVTSTVRTLVTVTAPTAQASATIPANSTAPAGSAQPTSTPVSSAPAASPSGGSASSTCSSNGAVVCNGETQFGLCNNGNVVWQAVAPGTKCQNGQIAKREFTHRIQRITI